MPHEMNDGQPQRPEWMEADDTMALKEFTASYIESGAYAIPHGEVDLVILGLLGACAGDCGAEHGLVLAFTPEQAVALGLHIQSAALATLQAMSEMIPESPEVQAMREAREQGKGQGDREIDQHPTPYSSDENGEGGL